MIVTVENNVLYSTMMNILSIETSCDETGVSFVCGAKEGDEYSFVTLANNLLSQAKLHAEYGGIFPSLAKREHAKAIIPLIEKTLIEAGVRRSAKKETNRLEAARVFLEREPETAEALEVLADFDMSAVDALAVTVGPGLAPALWVGVNTVRALSALFEKPIIPVNHMQGHLYSPLYPKSKMFELPALALLVSGGHTELLRLDESLKITELGATRDDALGEAFDKAARLLNLEYPSGALLAKEAQKHRDAHSDHTSALFPRPMIESNSFDVSYSGLKTALLYFLRDNPIEDDADKERIAREFEDAALDCIVAKVKKALEEKEVRSLVVGGGVIANTELRKRLASLSKTFSLPLYIPEMELTTDNSLMIAVAGFVTVTNGLQTLITDPSRIEALANLGSTHV
jgi:N6-L-threonylcarbamoyladenine synthase